MSRKIFINESQVRQFVILEESKKIEILEESFKGAKDKRSLSDKVRNALLKGATASMVIGAILNTHDAAPEKVENFVYRIEYAIKHGIEKPKPEWGLVSGNVFATVYNAEPKQCNDDVGHTSCMFRLNLKDVLSHKIIAMERTMMQKYGFKYGDVVKIEGTGKMDGIWQIQDTMNKRFAGQNKIDFLIPKSMGMGQWENVKLYKLNNKEKASQYKQEMAPQLSKEAFLVQTEQIKNGTYQCI